MKDSGRPAGHPVQQMSPNDSIGQDTSLMFYDMLKVPTDQGLYSVNGSQCDMQSVCSRPHWNNTLHDVLMGQLESILCDIQYMKWISIKNFNKIVAATFSGCRFDFSP